MMHKEEITNYWFKIEPYVYINIVDNNALLYNTLDGSFIEVDDSDVIDILNKILQKKECGVILLSYEKYQQKNIYDFICKLREMYMADIIDVKLSAGRPVQILPYYIFSDTYSILKKQCFDTRKKILNYLSEITLHLDDEMNIDNLISYLKSVPNEIIINVIGASNKKHKELFLFLTESSFVKNIICHYTETTSFDIISLVNFSYIVLVRFPIEISQWNYSFNLLNSRNIQFQYVFEVTSLEEYEMAEFCIKKYGIKKYQLRPIYTGKNISFFEEVVYLSKKEILSTYLSMNDFYTNKCINIYDFGKIHIMSNGDIYANLNKCLLGNICTHSIYDIISIELENGESWLRIRDQVPCNTCLYQWNCPPPSDYEIEIGRPNLCHVKS